MNGGMQQLDGVARVQRGAPAGFSPDDISGLLYWFASDTLALANTDPVAAWADSSGNGYDLAQASSGARPVYRTSQINGKPAVDFASASRLSLSEVSVAQRPDYVTVFGVLNGCSNRDAKAVSRPYTDSSWGSPYQAWSLNMNDSTYDPCRPYILYSGGYLAADSGVAEGVWGIFCVRYRSDEARIYLNAVSIGTQWITAPLAYGDAGTFVLGARQSSGGGEYNGKIAEVLVYNSALSDSDLTSVFTYLNGRYAIY